MLTAAVAAAASRSSAAGTAAGISPSTTAVGIVLATAGAVLFAVGALLQHGAVDTAAGASSRWRHLAAAVRRPTWSGGLICLGLGAALHAAALASAPVAVVQPIGVLSLTLITLLQARRQGRRVDRATGAAIATCMVGICSFVALAGATVTPGSVTPDRRLAAGVIAASLAAALAAAATLATRGIGRRVAMHRHPRGTAARAALLAGATGACYGLVSLLVRALSQDVRAPGDLEGPAGVVTAATAVAIVGALLIGGLLIQLAYAAAPPQVAVAAVTVADPVVAVGLGLTVFAEGSRIGGWPAASAALAAAVAITGVVLLTGAVRGTSRPSRPAEVDDDVPRRAEPGSARPIRARPIHAGPIQARPIHTGGKP